MRIVYGFEAARTTILARHPLEEAELPPEARHRLRDLFGEDLNLDQAVDRLIAEVRQQGDAALREWTYRIDGVKVDNLEVSRDEILKARQSLDPKLIRALELAAGRVRSFHEQQRRPGWMDFCEGGLGQIIRPLDRVGIYVPGGKASYPSTVLMTAIPARVAGVTEIVIATPPGPGGCVPAITLAAAAVAGVDRVFRIGGAQAIAALAFGTESVPRVDKIVGPGNIFVVLAKRKLFGVVGVDGLPGPTETVLIADEKADPSLCAADLLAQAEHDVLASAILITTSDRLARQVSEEVDRRLRKLERREIAGSALARQGGIAVVASLDEAVELANLYAPEHLCLLVQDPWPLIGRVRNAGGIFIGEGSPEALGDYIAGPSHVMPTSGTARFASALSVADFVKTISLVAITPDVTRQIGPAAALLARSEGLLAHAEAIEERIKER